MIAAYTSNLPHLNEDLSCTHMELPGKNLLDYALNDSYCPLLFGNILPPWKVLPCYYKSSTTVLKTFRIPFLRYMRELSNESSERTKTYQVHICRDFKITISVISNFLKQIQISGHYERKSSQDFPRILKMIAIYFLQRDVSRILQFLSFLEITMRNNKASFKSYCLKNTTWERTVCRKVFSVCVLFFSVKRRLHLAWCRNHTLVHI